MTAANWCPACREETALTTSGRCPFCDTALTAKADARGRDLTRRRGVASKLSDDQARVLHQLHLERRVSLREIARQVHEQLGYRTAASCVEGIRAAWKRLGLGARDRVDATVLASTKHGRARRSGADPDYRREVRARARARGAEWATRSGWQEWAQRRLKETAA